MKADLRTLDLNLLKTPQSRAGTCTGLFSQRD